MNKIKNYFFARFDVLFAHSSFIGDMGEIIMVVKYLNDSPFSKVKFEVC